MKVEKTEEMGDKWKIGENGQTNYTPAK